MEKLEAQRNDEQRREALRREELTEVGETSESCPVVVNEQGNELSASPEIRAIEVASIEVVNDAATEATLPALMEGVQEEPVSEEPVLAEMEVPQVEATTSGVGSQILEYETSEDEMDESGAIEEYDSEEKEPVIFDEKAKVGLVHLAVVKARKKMAKSKQKRLKTKAKQEASLLASPITLQNSFDVLSTDSSGDVGSPEFYTAASLSPSQSFLCEENVTEFGKVTSFSKST